MQDESYFKVTANNTLIFVDLMCTLALICVREASIYLTTPTTPNPHPHSLMWKVFTIANVVLKVITNNMSIGVLPKVESIYFWQLH